MEILIHPDEYALQAEYYLELDERYRRYEEDIMRREIKYTQGFWDKQEQGRPLHERIEDGTTPLTPSLGAKLEEWEVDL